MDKLLVANRGEIACRVFSTAKKLGLATVAIYSDADCTARHRRCADESWRVGSAASKDSYLNIEHIIRAAKESGATMVHPGYGFLSENHEFAAAVIAAGITWIGPSPQAIELLGDKVRSKERAAGLNIPLLPSLEVTLSSSGEVTNRAELDQFIAKTAFPVMVKAAGGGGGRGMRKVFAAPELDAALQGASREAGAFFGNTRIFVEKLVERGRHIEVQIVGDQHGSVAHLFDRDCSLQRRHQKIIEEAPALTLPELKRQALFEAAVKLGKAVNYTSLGTVEFLIDSAGNFYFLEVNSRLQVEHTVTEMVTGLDLVELQIKIALGASLSELIPSLRLSGHAIQARVCTERPEHEFASATGQLLASDFPPSTAGSSNIRVDSGFERFDLVTHHYDSLVAKVICHAPTRAESIAGLAESLSRSALFGVHSNLAYLLWLLNSESFRENSHSLERADSELTAMLACNQARLVLAFAALASTLIDHQLTLQVPENSASSISPWQVSNSQSHRALTLELESRAQGDFTITRSSPSSWELASTEKEDPLDARFEVSDLLLDKFGLLRCKVTIKLSDSETRATNLVALKANDRIWLTSHLGTHSVTVHVPKLKSSRAGATQASGKINSHLPGTVLKVNVKAGQQVKTGEQLITLESMKMEHPILAPGDGVITECHVSSGDVVQAGTVLVEMTVG